MANFLFENNSKTDWKSIEVIMCPNPNDCKNETGDGRYDNFNVPPDQSHQLNTKCEEICWRYSGGEYTRTSNRVISI